MATPLLHYSIDSPVKHRQLRVNALLKRELSNSIAREVTFESALVSINHVDVTSDLKNAHVFVSVLGSADGAAFRAHQRFAIPSHVRPDGDALGSQLALALSLKQLGKDIRVWNEDGMLEKYSFVPHADLLTNT